MRLDHTLVHLKLADSRSKAQYYIKMKAVTVNGKIVAKNSYQVTINDSIQLLENPCIYVSRGGLKLEKAIESFGIIFKDKVVLDLGASTGGFTDCALQHGAKKVYAVDVGHNQLHKKLLHSDRVLNLEGLNIKNINNDIFNCIIDLVTVDVSFISLAYVFKALKNVIENQCSVIALIKPQFEAGVRGTSKGVIKKPSVHREILQRVVTFANSEGFNIIDLTYAPYKTDAGNIEFLGHFIFTNNQFYNKINIKEIVYEAHNNL